MYLHLCHAVVKGSGRSWGEIGVVMGTGFKHCAEGEAGREGGVAYCVISLTTGDWGRGRPALSTGTGDILKWIGVTITQLWDLSGAVC